MMSEKEGIQVLRDAGLVICEPGEPGDSNVITNTYVLAHPLLSDSADSSVASRPNQVQTEMPETWLAQCDDGWMWGTFRVVPGPDPMGFEHRFADFASAINAILAYYFGDRPVKTPAPLLSPDQLHCASCERDVFRASSDGSWAEAERFLQTATFKDALQMRRSGFVPTGIYCASCGLLAENAGIFDEYLRLFLIEAGPFRTQVIVALRKELGINLDEARSIADTPGTQLFESHWSGEHEQLWTLWKKLRECGAVVEVLRYSLRNGLAREQYDIAIVGRH